MDLNGYTVSQATSFSNTDYSTGLINVKSGLTIKNGDLKAIDGNSNRVINIQDLTSDTSLTLNDVNVIGPENGSYTRGISAYKNSGKIDINISGGSVSANYYAINIASDNTEIIVDVNNSAVSSGYCAAQTHSSNSEMTFTDCTLIGKNKYSGSSDDFATVVLNTTATGSKITLNNCTIEASQTGTANEQFMSLRCSSFNIELDNCNYIWKGNAIDVTEMMEEPLTYIHTYYSFDYVYDNNKLTLSAPVSSE